MEIIARNVCHALPLGLEHLMTNGQEEPSRVGPVLVAPSPVITIYQRPWERVLFSSARDANPFFHLAEAMWMLAGRQDAAFLDRFVQDFGARYAENDGTIHGAYGYRWRTHFGRDQLNAIVGVLHNEPSSRQCVLSMWDAAVSRADDLTGIGWRDRPCNTHAYFRIREGLLDMTVCCRSNDIIWGAYGANVVHFSFLQEYLAARIGVGIGLYYQISNNFHAYVSEIEKLKTRATNNLFYALFDDRYLRNNIPTTPLVDDPSTFDEEVITVLKGEYHGKVHNEFLSETVIPALKAHSNFKYGYPTDGRLSEIAAEDWRVACTEWISRRQTRAEADKSLATTRGHISKIKQWLSTAGRSSVFC